MEDLDEMGPGDATFEESDEGEDDIEEDEPSG
jgi:hypothetical protein